jgi:hypothetical protein
MSVPAALGPVVHRAPLAAGGRAVVIGEARRGAVAARAERIGFTVAACAAVAVVVYAGLQIAGQYAAGPHAPPDAIPLFWRVQQAGIASSLAGPGFWWIARARPQRARARMLSALLASACAAIAACAALWP